jgi:hypothetical protein
MTIRNKNASSLFLKVNYSENIKDNDWNKFINEWGKQFEDAKNILRILNSYPEFSQIAGIRILNTPSDIENNQRDWIRLVSKIEGQDNIDFLMPWWVIMETTEYDSFMDLSDQNYPIFKLEFYQSIIPHWWKKMVFPNVSELLKNIEDSEKLMSIVSQYSKEHHNCLRKTDEEQNGEEEIVDDDIESDSEENMDTDFDGGREF